MQITVVIPTYQRPALLRNCLVALQKQLLPKALFEVLVVSDGPDEVTAGVVSEFKAEGNFKCLALPFKKGPAAARNLGWLSAKAPLIAFTDDDTLPNERWLQQLLAVADTTKAMAFTGRVIVPCGERPTDFELMTAGLETADFVTANCACTKLALIATGGFDERFSMAWREDSDLEFKLISQDIPIVKADLALVVHPVRKAAWGISIKEQKKTFYNPLLYSKYPALYRSRIQVQPPYLYYCIIGGFDAFLLGAVFKLPVIMEVGAAVWLLLTIYFTIKRLYRTSLSGTHIAEMAYTSLFIPFYSIYWQWYGSFKYRTLLI